MTTEKLTLTDAQESLEKYLSSVDPEELELDDFLVDFAVYMRKFRLNQRLTQTEAAKLCGMKQAMVSKIEGGDYNPSIALLWKYVRKLGGQLAISVEPMVTNKTTFTIQEAWKKPELDFAYDICLGANANYVCTSMVTEGWGG